MISIIYSRNAWPGRKLRNSREAAAENREKIVAVAAKLFRERGIAAVGVAELMEVCREIIRVNELKASYIRPIAFLGEGEMVQGRLPHGILQRAFRNRRAFLLMASSVGRAAWPNRWLDEGLPQCSRSISITASTAAGSGRVVALLSR